MRVDCEIYKEKISAFQAQVAELQKERDQVCVPAVRPVHTHAHVNIRAQQAATAR